jgi:hypothetical protein
VTIVKSGAAIALKAVVWEQGETLNLKRRSTYTGHCLHPERLPPDRPNKKTAAGMVLVVGKLISIVWTDPCQPNSRARGRNGGRGTRCYYFQTRRVNTEIAVSLEAAWGVGALAHWICSVKGCARPGTSTA